MSNSSQKGVSLYITIMTLAIVLAIVLGVSAILVAQMKMIRSIGYSVIAIYAADTGIEQALNDIYGGTYINIYPSVVLDNTAVYSVNVVCTFNGSNCFSLPNNDSSCSAPRFCINSVGSYKDARRAIKASI